MKTWNAVALPSHGALTSHSPSPSHGAQHALNHYPSEPPRAVRTLTVLPLKLHETTTETSESTHPHPHPPPSLSLLLSCSLCAPTATLNPTPTASPAPLRTAKCPWSACCACGRLQNPGLCVGGGGEEEGRNKQAGRQARIRPKDQMWNSGVRQPAEEQVGRRVLTRECESIPAQEVSLADDGARTGNAGKRAGWRATRQQHTQRTSRHPPTDTPTDTDTDTQFTHA